MLVGEQRAVVAGHTLALADKQPQAVDFRRGKHRLRWLRIPHQAFHIAVKPRLAVCQCLLECRNRLAHIGKHAVDSQLGFSVQCAPSLLLGRRAGRPRIGWHRRQIRHGLKHCLVFRPVMGLHQMRVARPVATMLDGIFPGA